MSFIDYINYLGIGRQCDDKYTHMSSREIIDYYVTG